MFVAFLERFADIFFNTDNVYIRYFSWDGFPIYFHCLCLLHLLEEVSVVSFI